MTGTGPAGEAARADSLGAPVLAESLAVQAGQVVVFSDTTLHVERDTVLVLDPTRSYDVLRADEYESKVFYDSLKAKAEENPIGKKIVGAILKPEGAVHLRSDFVASRLRFDEFAGGYIARIEIFRATRFTGSVDDTSFVDEAPDSAVTGSVIGRTRESVIRDNLIFEEGEMVRPAEFADAERILRELPFIEDARLHLVRTAPGSDSVRVFVVTKDRFPIGAKVSARKIGDYHSSVYHRNVAGLGHELRFDFYRKTDRNPRSSLMLTYVIRNLRGSFVEFRTDYRYAWDERGIRMTLDRGFLTPRTKYAWGLECGVFQAPLDEEQADTLGFAEYEKRFGDLWGGRAFLVGGRESRRNFILAGRAARRDFPVRPPVSEPENTEFHNGWLCLAGLSYRKIDYILTNKLAGLGPTEDVPVGYLVGCVGGYREEEFRHDPYFGASLGYARTWESAGYFVTRAGVGGFTEEGRVRDGALRFRGTYFTDLKGGGDWEHRYLARLTFLSGIGYEAPDDLDLSWSMRGMPAGFATGRSTLSLGLERVAFAPWNLVGFRFAPFVFLDSGILSPTKVRVDDYHGYGTIGFGCRIRNESLVFDTFNLRFGYLMNGPDGADVWDIHLGTGAVKLLGSIDIERPAIIGFR